MFCAKCGSQIPENSSFCMSCGAKTEQGVFAAPPQNAAVRQVYTKKAEKTSSGKFAKAVSVISVLVILGSVAAFAGSRIYLYVDKIFADSYMDMVSTVADAAGYYIEDCHNNNMKVPEKLTVEELVRTGNLTIDEKYVKAIKIEKNTYYIDVTYKAENGTKYICTKEYE